MPHRMRIDTVSVIRCLFTRRTSTSELAGRAPSQHRGCHGAFNFSRLPCGLCLIVCGTGLLSCPTQVSDCSLCRCCLKAIFALQTVLFRANFMLEQQETALFGSSSVQAHALFVSAEADLEQVAELNCFCSCFWISFERGRSRFAGKA